MFAVALLMAGWFVLGLGSIYDISEVSLRQATTPDRLLGRVNATRHFAFSASCPSARSWAASWVR